MKKVILAFAALLAAWALALTADYLTRQIRLIVPFAPGGGTDVLARINDSARARSRSGKSPRGRVLEGEECAGLRADRAVHRNAGRGQGMSTISGHLRRERRAVRENTNEFIFKIADVLAHFTRFVVFEPGDLIALGAPKGTAMSQPNAAELYLKPGGRLEIAIEGLMTLRMRIVEEL